MRTIGSDVATDALARMTYDALYIGGEWVRSDGSATVPIISPSTEMVVGSIPDPTFSDMGRAVSAARMALDEGPWPRLTPGERAMFLRALAAEITSREEQFSRTLAIESGIPVSGSANVEGGVRRLTYYADLAAHFEFEKVRHGTTRRILVRKEPVGVVAAIIPWNAPLGISLMKLAPALLAGCTMVLKAAPQAPLTCYLIAEACAAVGLPPGVVNVLAGDREVSESLVRHPGVDKVSFTGSTVIGRKVAAICGEHLKRCSLELGGKSAAIVLEDADLEDILPKMLSAATTNNGQACVLQSRVLLPRTRYREMSDAITGAISKMVVGDPLDPETRFGPLISAAQRERVEAYVALGRDEGAKVLLGGGRPAHLARGWYVEPTVFADVDNGARIAQEEIFGPVIALIPYGNKEDAVRVANDSRYGLSGTVWTTDLDAGLDVARRVRTGNYGINVFGMDVCAPFGGYKESGIGREMGPEGLDAFLETKSVHLPDNFPVR